MLVKNLIVVLGCKIVECNNPTLMMKNRVDTLKEIDKPLLIILSGGYTNPQCNISEALMMKQYMKKNNLNTDNVVLEERSMDTVGNAVHSKILLSEMDINYSSITLVTSCFHKKRASRIFEYIFKGTEIITDVCAPWNIDYSKIEAEKWVRDKEFLEMNNNFTSIVNSLERSNKG